MLWNGARRWCMAAGSTGRPPLCTAAHCSTVARTRRRRGFWRDAGNRRNFVDELKRIHSIDGPKGWRGLTCSDVVRAGGAGLLAHYKGSMLALLQGEVAEMAGEEVTSMRKRVPNGHWERRENRREFMDGVAARYGVQAMADWRRVSYADVFEAGGSRVLHMFGDSLFALLLDTYGGGALGLGGRDTMPGALAVSESNTKTHMHSDAEGTLQSVSKEKDRMLNVFQCRSYVPSEFWRRRENVRAFLDYVATSLGLEEDEEWLRLSRHDLRELNGAGLLAQMSLAAALQQAYPEKVWASLLQSGGAKRSRQRQTRATVARVFPTCQVLEEHRVGGVKSTMGGELVLDVYIPEVRLAVEYNGEQHYHEVPIFGPLEVTQRRDREKATACEELGIRLFVVPYWWDGRLDSFLASLHKQFPTLLRSAPCT
mmetsp:Transcript_10792/g.44229  ORF Transcript_10792/g.44229 Transcript_10792/m.44229 type:complete len:426 (+) Transcript_10792:100-1377(+)